jgi:uncharacterized protein (DUF302 family)
MKHYALVFLAVIIAANSLADTTHSGLNPGIAQNAQTKNITRYAVKGDFNDTKAFLTSTIEGRGIKISSVLHISDMLQRTGEAVGDTTPIYKHAEAIEFCSASLSRQMMLANPHNIVFCPFSILIYELANSPGTIYLAYRRPFDRLEGKTDASRTKIDELLRGIVEETVK